LLRTFGGHNDWVNAVAITPDGKQAVSASSDQTLIIWDLQSGTLLKTLAGHTQHVNAVAITPSGKKAVSGASDNTLKIWNLQSGTLLKTLRGHTARYEPSLLLLMGSKPFPLQLIKP
jgi:WD40 repeat protein